MAAIMNQAGFDAAPYAMDLADRASIVAMIEQAQQLGPIKMLVNAAGVSPSQAKPQLRPFSRSTSTAQQCC